MVTNAQLTKLLLGLRLHDGAVVFLNGNRAALNGLGIAIHGDVNITLRWDKLDSEVIKAHWSVLSDLYNKPVMCVVGNNAYLVALMNDKSTKVTQYKYSDVLGMFLSHW